MGGAYWNICSNHLVFGLVGESNGSFPAVCWRANLAIDEAWCSKGCLPCIQISRLNYPIHVERTGNQHQSAKHLIVQSWYKALGKNIKLFTLCPKHSWTSFPFSGDDPGSSSVVVDGGWHLESCRRSGRRCKMGSCWHDGFWVIFLKMLMVITPSPGL